MPRARTKAFEANGWRSTLTDQQLERIRQDYHIPGSIKLRAPESHERVSVFTGRDEVGLHEDSLKAGFRFPIPREAREVLAYLSLAPSQLMPNGWRILLACSVLWPSVLGAKHRLSVKEFLYCYHPQEKYIGVWTFHCRCSKRNLVSDLRSSNKKWKNRFFFISGGGWEFGNMDKADKQNPIGVNRRWGYLQPETYSEPDLSMEESEQVDQLVKWVAEDCTKRSFPELTSTENMDKYLFHPKPSPSGIGIISNDIWAIVKSQKSRARGLKEADARPSKKAKTSWEDTTPVDAQARRHLASFVVSCSKGLLKEKVPSQTKSAEAPSAAATPVPGASKPLTARPVEIGPAAQPERTAPMGLEASASSGSDVPYIIRWNSEAAAEQPGAPHREDRVPEARQKGVVLDMSEGSDSSNQAGLPPATQSGPHSPARWVEQLGHPVKVLEKIFPADCFAKRRGEPCKTISERLCRLLAQAALEMVALCKEQAQHESDMQSLGKLETTQAKLKDTRAQLDNVQGQLNDARSQQKSEDYTAVLTALCGDLEAKEAKRKLTQAALEEKEAELKSVREELESEKARSAEFGSIHTDFEAARAKLEALHIELKSEKAKSKALECLWEKLAAEKERSAKLEANLQAKQAELTSELNNVKTKLDAELAHSSQLGIEPSTVQRELEMENTQLKLRHSQGQWESVSDKLEIIRKDLETERDLISQLKSQLWKARVTREAAWGLGFTQGFDTLRDLVEGGPPKMDISKLDAEDFVPGPETLEARASLEDNIAQDGPSVPEGVLHEEDPATSGTDEPQSSSSSA